MAFRPVQYKEVQHFINRAYNECQAFQWARETLKNALEAGATKVHFGVEYQAVERRGVYRRLIADNGKGMTEKQLYEYFSYAGNGEKRIGGEHDNFGIGAKISLMPWNPYGLVIVSWVDGKASMIWIQKSPQSGEYGLRSFEEYGDDNVVEPFDDPEHGCDWSKVKPDFIEDHGTVIVLLGGSAKDDTVEGDPNRPSEHGASRNLIHYLNQRFWVLPEGAEVTVNRFLNDRDRSKWPHDARAGRLALDDDFRRGAYITLYGSRVHITQARRKGRAEVLSGTVPLQDGTRVHWFFLKHGDMPDQAQGPSTSFIGILYKDELYHVTSHHAFYRTMGVTPQAVRTRLWVVLEPPVDAPPKVPGVYPESARSALKYAGTPDRSVPTNDWLAEFSKHMPEAIRQALAEAFGDQKDDSNITSRLMGRLSQYLNLWGKKFKQRKLSTVEGGGDESVDVNLPISGGVGLVVDAREGRTPSEQGDSRAHDPVEKTPIEALAEGIDQKNARRKTSPRQLPQVQWREKTDFGDPENHLAQWIETQHLIQLNKEHLVIKEQIARWQSRYPDHLAEDVAGKVRDVYSTAVLSVFLATEGLSVGKFDRENRFRTPDVLTVALLGYFREDEIIRQQLSYLGKAKEGEE
ncbi:ATP-binding protein [Archangium sp. Cb G35]|uniref:ATP-binding protein n=1 Tax=Archangium sp. Cb G35 TaxID=1920190 RepID=UPI000B07D36A|nr:ATP-binding protein [Archangium sp. Cb G35]